ncbi:hypothetical protein BZA05DRAFT_416053 [Tricharina praecox]|uniref:uncharacterized protein n=1 Tax=Tricharina praecox TaxID=43433 RepID=UPI00221EA091|nr:uncharacterized protein BZA05DRAFT_416053 [Tricharina praecox]KAI5856357.1 hypothetical protein BZA05DRAFT_416053 [Tricharina praecox]
MSQGSGLVKSESAEEFREQDKAPEERQYGRDGKARRRQGRVDGTEVLTLREHVTQEWRQHVEDISELTEPASWRHLRVDRTKAAEEPSEQGKGAEDWGNGPVKSTAGEESREPGEAGEDREDFVDHLVKGEACQGEAAEKVFEQLIKEGDRKRERGRGRVVGTGVSRVMQGEAGEETREHGEAAEESREQAGHGRGR